MPLSTLIGFVWFPLGLLWWFVLIVLASFIAGVSERERRLRNLAKYGACVATALVISYQVPLLAMFFAIPVLFVALAAAMFLFA